MTKVSEFKEYLKEHKPNKIIFMSERQNEYDIADPLVLSLTFSSILVGQNPNVIYMTDGINSWRLNMIKGLRLRKSASSPCAEVDVLCRSREGDKMYTLLVS